MEAPLQALVRGCKQQELTFFYTETSYLLHLQILHNILQLPSAP